MGNAGGHRTASRPAACPTWPPESYAPLVVAVTTAQVTRDWAIGPAKSAFINKRARCRPLRDSSPVSSIHSTVFVCHFFRLIL